ncbi:MAG TPA: phenylalanine--tRNA ligase subunit alpha [Methylomirabilota bacterium]|jgi:phenylalanyl-tRNA synthetase alpha chain|nr:phenylalanine--tRNA ligase subunit alpha [Methylomirabilota bacterium]
MIESLKQLKEQIQTELDSTQDLQKLDELVVKYFGRKQGKLTHILRSLKDIDARQRKILGAEANELKLEMWKQFDEKRQSIKNSGKKEFIDLTVDGTKPVLGHLHPITQVRREVERIFQQLGFGVVLGPEVESDYYNFEALNIPAEHPARDMWDTFYIKAQGSKGSDKLLLRTHISPMQVRVMEKNTPPFAVVSSGRVFRHEATDARHEHTWDYTEGFLVGENISLANLKATLLNFFQQLFNSKIEIKLRSSYFPFTEPSFEVLMSCIFCQKKGCSICSHVGWLEMAGAGMIHPKVFEHAHYKEGQYSGFAFGLGISRIAMLKYNIPDVRMFYENDIRFLKQF